MIEQELPRPLHDKIDAELESSERLEWIGMPAAKYFTLVSTVAFLMAMPFTAFAVVWIVIATWGTRAAGDQPLPLQWFGLCGLPFVFIGLAMFTAPFWAHRKALRTAYVITDRRAIILEGGWWMTVRSFRPSKLQGTYRRERPDGTGDVILTRTTTTDSEGHQRATELGFLRIKNPRAVEAMFKQLAQTAQSQH